MEFVEIYVIATPLQRLAIRHEHDACDCICRPGRTVVAGDPTGRCESHRPWRNWYVDLCMEQLARSIGQVGCDLDGSLLSSRSGNAERDRNKRRELPGHSAEGEHRTSTSGPSGYRTNTDSHGTAAFMLKSSGHDMRRVSIKGVLIGSVVDIVASLLSGILIAVFVVLISVLAHIQRRSLDQFGALAGVWFACGLVISALGGYIAARIARHDEVLNGALSASLCILIEHRGGIQRTQERMALIPTSPSLWGNRRVYKTSTRNSPARNRSVLNCSQVALSQNSGSS